MYAVNKNIFSPYCVIGAPEAQETHARLPKTDHCRTTGGHRAIPGRKNVRDANRKLAKLVLAWVLDHPISDQEFMEQFEVSGHKSEYHENPIDSTSRMVMPQALELPNILKRLEDTPLDYMGALELSYVYERIQTIIAMLGTTPRGTMEDAIDLYARAGGAIRQKVYTETGHYPEEFLTPRGRITGSEEPSQFKVADHQPKLF